VAQRAAIVTGASSGIGLAIARMLGEEGYGITAVARRPEKLAEAVAGLREQGYDVQEVAVELSSEEAVQQVVAAHRERFGRLDVLVNNASVRREVDFGTLDYQEWRDILGTTLDGAYLCSRAALPHLIASGEGSIVNIGGLSSHMGAPRRAHVIAAKAGLVGLTRALAHDLAPHRITVNCVAPGLIDTTRSGPEPSHHQSLATPVGRKGRPEEIATLVRFLCGPGARYITGQTIHANGGLYMG
jgi:3-oxoacyl-[acyl-carrier protein] reductase